MADYPVCFLENMARLLGSEYPAFFSALQDPPTRALRLNPAKPCAMSGQRVPWEPDGVYVEDELKPGGEPLHFAGSYYMQEASAMAPARVLNVRPGEVALDLCAAPGGKSGQLAAALGGQGALVSNEIDSARAKALGSNLERLGVRNALVTNAVPSELARRCPETFDAILVDAPCSGEGMFRRDPASRAQWSPGSPAGCAARQLLILRDAARMLKPGGRMVYSTCTFNALENEGVVRDFLGEHPDFEALDFELSGAGASAQGMLRLWPHRVRGEGQFMALLRKTGAPPPPMPADAAKPRDVVRHALAQLAQLLGEGRWREALDGLSPTPSPNGELLWGVPQGAPRLDGLALRPGLCLCKMGKNYAKPEHALAMALSATDVAQSIELDAAEARRFLQGHELSCPASLSGWALVTHQRLSIGWGKAVSGSLKNHIPKGLRLH